MLFRSNRKLSSSFLTTGSTSGTTVSTGFSSTTSSAGPLTGPEGMRIFWRFFNFLDFKPLKFTISSTDTEYCSAISSISSYHLTVCVTYFCRASPALSSLAGEEDSFPFGSAFSSFVAGVAAALSPAGFAASFTAAPSTAVPLSFAAVPAFCAAAPAFSFTGMKITVPFFVPSSFSFMSGLAAQISSMLTP